MSSILLTSDATRQRPAMRDGTSAPSCSGKAMDATVQAPGGNYLKRAAAQARVETALFVSVQAVMIACVLLVAAQLLTAV